MNRPRSYCKSERTSARCARYFFQAAERAASQENADSRVYAGIHFRSACQDGIKLGKHIGRRAFIQYVQVYRD